MIYTKIGYFFLFLLIVAIIGFWKTYFSHFIQEGSFYVHFHVSTMLIWMFVLITQPFLIQHKRIRLHRLLGKSTYILFPFLVIGLILLAHHKLIIYDFGSTYSRQYVLFLQLSLLLAFIIFYALAIIYRKNPLYHARYMIATSFTLIDPVVARLPLGLPEFPFPYQIFTFAITDLLIIFLIIFERKKSKGREVFPIVLLIFLFFQILNLTITSTSIWGSFSVWFATLPLT